MANLLSTILSGNNHITFGPNSTWSSYLRVGGNGHSVSSNEYASVVTTNGNLHLDAGTSRATYINYYAGTAGVAFGNGASGISAWMGADGDLWKGGSDNSGTQYVYNSGTWGISITGNASKLDPLSGDGNYKLAYTADGARNNAGEWGRAVMYYVPNGQTYGIRVDRADYSDNSGALSGLGVGSFLRDDGWNTYPGQDANTQGEMRVDFTYSNNAPYTGELIRFGSSGYSTQFNTSYGNSDNFAFRTRNGDNATWNAWRNVIHSGNIGSQSVNYATSAGNSDTLDSLDSSEFARGRASYQVLNLDDVKQPGLYQYDGGIGGTQPAGTNWYNVKTIEIGSSIRYSQFVMPYSSNRVFYRYRVDAGWQPYVEFITSGNIASQSVSYADESGYSASTGTTDNIGGVQFRNTGSNAGTNADTIDSNGITYYTAGVANFSGNATDGALYSQRYSTSWQHQIAGDYRSGMIAVRGRNNGTWTSWRTIIDSSTIGSQSVNYASSAGNSNTTSQIVFSDLKTNFPSGDGGGHNFAANHYSMGLDSGNGGWSHPHYRDVIIGYHTGIRIGAHYSGIRFYNNSPTTDANNDGNGDGGEALLMTIGGYVGTANHTDVVVNNNLFANVSMRAPIFYDSNDTYYYVDPNSMSRISSARIVGGELRFHNSSYYSDLNYWGARFYSQDDGNGVPLYVQVQWVDGWRTSLKIASGIDDNNPSLRTYGRTQLATDGGFVGIATTSPFAELDVNGRLAVRGGNRLYWGATTTLGSWTTAQYASGSTHLFNAQRFDFTNEGYGSTTFAIINSEGLYTNNSILFPQAQFSPSAGSRTLTPPMSIRMFDNYFSGIGLGSDYGTVIEYYSRIGHVDTQVYFDAAGGSWYRTASYAAGYSAWNQYITSGNIGSQNVNASNYQYATGSSSDAIASFRQTPAHATSFREISSSGPAGTWWMIQNFRHSNSSNYWGTQVAWGWEDNALRLMQRNVSADSWSGWVEYLNTNNAAYAWNMNQYVRTSDAVTFASTTTQTFLIASHSDNTKGYRIYNTSNSSVSAMFVNSANALVIGAGAFDQVQFNKKVLVSGAALGVNVAASATAGRIDASNDIVAYSSSDERLKYNIAPIENALDKVKSLTGVEFDWKPEYKHAHGYEGHDTGIIAQQVEAVMPSAVRTNDTGFLAVRYEKLIGLLIEGMKEQQAQIDELKAKLDGIAS